MSGTPSAFPHPAPGETPVDRTAGRARAIGSRADVATTAPARYAKQLIAHLGRKVPFTGDAVTAPATAVIGAATAGIVVGEGVLTLEAAGDDEESVARVEQVLGSHLERFAQREGLTVRWVRDAGAPTATPVPPPEESA
ncbi:hypothetical protein SAMN05660642_01931 [Geodermatophilus siccatus]|uniref:DUF2218 domain-containing protein n=1 Tax=Geodermatophilus siccatus TaxID=1137991 RepID=A0A1G9RHQ1_9ACTN|nr:DUF2218 domain-containing protein [Geodermatophilus siccatus]SDM22766.1 hypothetical protein SAMN05660642_01931 [Geodermatophilus siccatus]